MITAFVIAACGGQHSAGPSGDSHRPAILNTATVPELVASFSKAGLPVPNAHDVTPAKCPEIGCTDAVDSDTVSVIKFGNTGAAERFAGTTPDVYQIEDVVLVFTSTVPDDHKAAYEQIARTAVMS